MREEIEAAALFITKLVNKNLSTSSASSTHSSSSSASSSTSESPPGFDEVQPPNGGTCVNGQDQDNKVEQFRQCLMKALYERFHNHWFPEQPTKGQAYRCIRLNEWDRHDTTLQQACLQCGIDYKDLQLPVELTLWVDPDEVTCRFGENKGSHCLVAKFKDGELRDKNLDIDINDINIEIFRQTTEVAGPVTVDKMRSTQFQGSPDYNSKQHNQHNMINNNNNHINQNSSYHFHHQNSHHHHQHNHHHHLQQQQQQQHPQAQQNHHLGKATILPSYHNNYLTDNPIYYYF